MNYIFDVTLNFNKELYNFYEWEKDDDISYYIKIPIFKIEKEIIMDFISSSFIVEKQFLNKIYKKSELYDKKSKIFKDYSCIFVSDNIVLAVMFDEKGNSIKKSYLSIDEEDDILEYSKGMKYTLIDYKIKEKKNNPSFLTRKEYSNKIKLLKDINSIYQKNEYSKLKYIFFEVYNEKNEDEKLIYSKLINLVNNSDSKREKMIEVIKSI